MNKTPTPEQLQDAKTWFDDLMDDMCCGNCQPLEKKCIQSQSQHALIQFTLRFTAKALGEPSEEACMAFEERGGSTRLRAKAMIQRLCKECAE